MHAIACGRSGVQNHTYKFVRRCTRRLEVRPDRSWVHVPNWLLAPSGCSCMFVDVDHVADTNDSPLPTGGTARLLLCFRVPWVACPLDTAAERVDLCLGTWWETPERREITPFTATMFPASFMLVVPSYTSNEGLGVSQVFFPFTWALWVCDALPFLFKCCFPTLAGVGQNEKVAARIV